MKPNDSIKEPTLPTVHLSQHSAIPSKIQDANYLSDIAKSLLDSKIPISQPPTVNTQKPEPKMQSKISKSGFNQEDNDKENRANFDWQTKINISTTTNTGNHSNLTSSLIASISSSSSSKPTTPERKRQKNEIITKILAREVIFPSLFIFIISS